MVEIKNISGVVLDNDDTKTDTFGSVKRLMREFAFRYNLKDPSEDKLRQLWGRKIDEVWGGVFPEVPLSDIGRLRDEFISENFAPPHFLGVREAIVELVKRGYEIGVVSTAPRMYLTRVIDRLAFSGQAFAFVHGLEDTDPYHKPDPRVFDKAEVILKERGVGEDEVCYVGDNVLDFRAARDRRGWGFFGVLTGVTTRAIFR